jgi:hypothetical protein
MMSQMKKEQDDLERQLWEDRRTIHKTYEEKVKIAITKCVFSLLRSMLLSLTLLSRANMIGDSKISMHEADVVATSLWSYSAQKLIDTWDR